MTNAGQRKEEINLPKDTYTIFTHMKADDRGVIGTQAKQYTVFKWAQRKAKKLWLTGLYDYVRICDSSQETVFYLEEIKEYVKSFEM